MRIAVYAVLLGVLAASLRAQAGPTSKASSAAIASGITFFRADVTVEQDGELDVREEIEVNDAASFYRYGFRRDLPITPAERWEVRYVGPYKPDNGIRIEIREVTKDGTIARFEQGTGYGYSQITIGPKNVPLDAGAHRFTLRYTVESALKLGWTRSGGDARDLLYWNAIGEERNGPVAQAILAVHLPRTVPAEGIEADPRVAGRGVSYPREPDTALERIDDDDGAIVYRATNVHPRQSLSLAVTPPSGFIHRPRFEMLGRGSRLLLAPAALFLFYLIAWIVIGPEPAPGPLVVAYQPPNGLSAAAVRYAASGVSDGRSFAAVIAQLAVRKCLRAEPAEGGKHRLSRLMSDRATEAALAPEEQRVLRLLFSDAPVIELGPALDERNTAQNSLYVNAIHEELAKRERGKYLNRHFGVVALGGFATFAMALALAATASGRDPSIALFATMWILFVGLTLGSIIETGFISAWKTAVRGGMGWVRLFPGLAAFAVFAWVIGLLLDKLADGVSVSFAVMIVAFLAINLFWAPRLKRKSALGREVADKIAGFRRFLETVDQDRLDRMNVAGETPEELDPMLPYAIALEVKEAWGDHLAQTFAASTVMVEE